MTILSSELLFYRSTTWDDTATNGGTMSANALTSGVPQDVWPNVLKDERDNGSTKYRKIFLKVANDADDTLLAPQFWLDNPTKGDDWVVMFPGDQVDTQGSVSPSRVYGCASLTSDVSAGASTVTVTVEDASIVGIFANGDTVRITDKADPASATGIEEFKVLSSEPTVSGNNITMTFSTPLVSDYTVANNSRVSSVYKGADIACSVTNWAESSAAGTYDEGSYPIIPDNIGTIQEDWTLTFTDDSGNFTITDSSGASVGSWNKNDAGPAAPINPNFSGKPLFTLEFGGFGGTWVANDTITWTTSPAAQAIWERRDVPAGAGSLSGNSILLAVYGEST